MPKFLILSGIILVVAGLLWNILSKIPFLGRLPGDILIRKKNFVFYFPWATSVLVSLVLSLIAWFMSKRSK